MPIPRPQRNLTQVALHHREDSTGGQKPGAPFTPASRPSAPPPFHSPPRDPSKLALPIRAGKQNFSLIPKTPCQSVPGRRNNPSQYLVKPHYCTYAAVSARYEAQPGKQYLRDRPLAQPSQQQRVAIPRLAPPSRSDSRQAKTNFSQVRGHTARTRRPGLGVSQNEGGNQTTRFTRDSTIRVQAHKNRSVHAPSD